MKQNSIFNTINEQINLFIDSKIAINLSKNSIYLYERILEHFYEFIASESDKEAFKSFRDINRYFLTEYTQKLQKNNFSDRTQHLYITIVKEFIFFIAESDTKKYGFLKENINKFTIKYEQKEATSFTTQEQTQILNLVAKLDMSDKFLDNRNSLMLKILLFTGLRITELLSIVWSDVEETDTEYKIKVIGKGRKQRYTYLNKENTQINIDILKTSNNQNKYLFTSAKGNPMDRKNAWSIVANLLKKANVYKTGLHIFRHTLGRNLANDNINLSIIKEILGHSNITTTAHIYAKVDENAKRKTLIHNSKIKLT